MSRLSDHFADRFPDDSPEPSPRRAYYAGAAEMERVVRCVIYNNRVSLDNRLAALDAILDTVRMECEREGGR